MFRYGDTFFDLFLTENRQGGICWEFPADQHAVDEAARLRHGLLVKWTTEGSFPRTRGKKIETLSLVLCKMYDSVRASAGKNT